MKNTKFIDIIVSIIVIASMVGGFVNFIDLLSNVEKECTPSQSHQQIIDILSNQKCELITYEQCIDEPLDCHIDSRSPEGFTCRPY